MAGSQDASENPVGINVVPMVDVIFCLCVFFMCSMQWKPTEGRLDAWLPKDKGASPGHEVVPEEIRVAIFWDDANRRAVRMMGRRRIDDDAQLRGLLADAHADRAKIGHPETPCIIDAGGLVPWEHVVNVIDLAKRAGIEKIEFAYGQAYEATPSRK